MENLPIRVDAVRGNWQRFTSRKKNKRFLEVKTKVLNRDKNTCRYCKFTSDKDMTIVNHDQNYSNNKSNNLVTAGSLCYPCFFIDHITPTNKLGGWLIYLPEVSQADLNHFCRILFSSMVKDAPYKGKLHSTYISLQDRSDLVEEVFGPDTSNPAIFGQTLLDANITKQQLDESLLNNIRYLPDRKYLHEQAKYWKKSVFNEIPL